ncbi:hypothetical protein [Collimonas sp. OK242]|uniref:hypothetical protein n=1 Tax=Collimonas sp. OK242 TaxID=1798195 RepID=UPI00115FB6BC|nr:hypothetical protein [Collimonas sp. OK242]
MAIASFDAMEELPLTIEDLLTDKGKVTPDAAFSYANSNQEGIAAGEPIIVEAGPTSFIALSTRIATLGLRYGLSKNAELYGRGSYV